MYLDSALEMIVRYMERALRKFIKFSNLKNTHSPHRLHKFSIRSVLNLPRKIEYYTFRCFAKDWRAFLYLSCGRDGAENKQYILQCIQIIVMGYLIILPLSVIMFSESVENSLY